MSNKGFLAIWCDIGEDDLQDYRHWLTREHIADRIFSPGFHGVRLFTALDDERSHFILYASESARIFESPSYLGILNRPSAWTQRIMPKFGPFDRAAGEQVIKLGNGFGAFAVISRLHIAPADIDLTALAQSLTRFMDRADVVSVRLMSVDRSSTDIKSQEKTMRAGAEGDFQYLLVVEAMSERGATAVKAQFDTLIRDALPGLQGHDVSVRKMIYGEAPYEGMVNAPGQPPA